MTDSRWVVSVDGQQLEGDHSVEEAKALVQQHSGKRVLVWSPGMAQWADPATIPQFREAPAPPPQAAPPPAAPEPVLSAASSAIDKEEIKKQAGFLKALLDFRFTSMITSRLIPILYLIVMAVIALGAVGYFLIGGGGAILAGIKLKSGFGILTGLIIMVLTPLLAVVYLALVRMWFEVLLVVFRIKEDLTVLVERSKPEESEDKEEEEDKK